MCERIGSPLYRELLARSADDVERGGPVWPVLERHVEDPNESVIGLRLLGAVHRLVLEGSAPALARHYPSAGGELHEDALWDEFISVVADGGDRLAELVARPVQTNEVGRSAALLCGFLLVAAETRLPLRLLELGASAGLNLRFDRYRYEGDAGAWGDERSPVRIAGTFEGEPPPLAQDVEIAARGGCDARPLDPTTEEGRLALLSYTWPDQPQRLRALEGALAIARELPVELERSGAADWLERRLAESAPGVATVVFHSVVMQYVAVPERERIERVLDEAGKRASVHAPLARLAMEPGGEHAEVRLTLWPGGQERLVASAGYHGRPVRFVGTSQR